MDHPTTGSLIPYALYGKDVRWKYVDLVDLPVTRLLPSPQLGIGFDRNPRLLAAVMHYVRQIEDMMNRPRLFSYGETASMSSSSMMITNMPWQLRFELVASRTPNCWTLRACLTNRDNPALAVMLNEALRDNVDNFSHLDI